MSNSGTAATQRGSLMDGRKPRPQSPACDRCTLGVLDSENPHLWGECKCGCHCTGAADCPAPRHVHGCFADMGHCDQPDERI